MMLTLVFLRFIGEKIEDGVENLRKSLIAEGLDPDDEAIKAAFGDDPTFPDGTYPLPIEARWSTIINTPAPQLDVALDNALHSIATSSKQLKVALSKVLSPLGIWQLTTSRRLSMKSTRSATKPLVRKRI